MVALNFGLGEIHSRPPESAQEHRSYELMALLTELTRKAAIAEKTERQLSMIQEATQTMMNNLEANKEANKRKKPDYAKEPSSSLSANGKK